MEKKTLYRIFLDLVNALTDTTKTAPLNKAKEIADCYNELNEALKQISDSEFDTAYTDINNAISLYIAYDELTTKIFNISQKYFHRVDE